MVIDTSDAGAECYTRHGGGSGNGRRKRVSRMHMQHECDCSMLNLQIGKLDEASLTDRS